MELTVLLYTAASLGIIHTLLGPDHYLPFIVLSRARSWSRSKTLWITFFSGVGHVAGSVVLGLVGVAMGLGLHRLERIESVRGNAVGWLLIGFGLLYSLYGVYRHGRHGHKHLPSFLTPKSLREGHSTLHRELHHVEEAPAGSRSDPGRLTPWILFLIFVFGPCEVLIPMLIYPAAEHNLAGVIGVALVFGTATVATMLAVVFVGYQGLSFLHLKGRESLIHVLAGVVILSAGLAMQFLGL
ncbi:MAG: sulfite exporter TauE/SafE family protein [Bacteroidales bacterium]